MCSRGVCIPTMPWEGTPPSECRPPARIWILLWDMVNKRRYASYWNAYFFTMQETGLGTNWDSSSWQLGSESESDSVQCEHFCTVQIHWVWSFPSPKMAVELSHYLRVMAYLHCRTRTPIPIWLRISAPPPKKKSWIKIWIRI